MKRAPGELPAMEIRTTSAVPRFVRRLAGAGVIIFVGPLVVAMMMPVLAVGIPLAVLAIPFIIAGGPFLASSYLPPSPLNVPRERKREPRWRTQPAGFARPAPT